MYSYYAENEAEQKNLRRLYGRPRLDDDVSRAAEQRTTSKVQYGFTGGGGGGPPPPPPPPPPPRHHPPKPEPVLVSGGGI